MKNQLVVISKVIDEKGRTGYGQAIVEALKNLTGKRAKITIEEYRRPRTNPQNAYYWAVIIKSYQRYFQSQNVYMPDDEMHLWIKEHVWRDFIDVSIENVSKDGVVTYIPFRKILSSTELDTQEWEARMTASRAYAAEHFGMQIPEPQEKISQQVKEWLERPEGIYYDAHYTNYFRIVPRNAD